MKTNTLILLTLSGTLLFTSCGKKAEDDHKEVAEEQNDEKFEERDDRKTADFVVEAADAGMLEVQLGQLAVTKAQSAEVKKVAQAMIDDHSKVNEELKGAAAAKNITVPAALSEKSQKVHADLSEKSGNDFDRAYIDQTIKDHKDAIDLFKKESEKGEDPALAQWAREKLPALQHHLEVAETTEKLLKDKK